MTDLSPAYAKIETMRRASASAKRAAWDEIKRGAPDVADFLTQVSAAFGKPAAVRVEIAGHVVLDQCELLPANAAKIPMNVSNIALDARKRKSSMCG